MSASSRSAQFAKLHKVLKKVYRPVQPNAQRPVLEHLLFACCLENAPYEKAEDALAKLVHTYFDWNEIRVTMIKELAEVMGGLPDPAAAAQRIRRVLQHVFEASYCFDLEELRKRTLGQAVERLEHITGTSRFAVSYVVQSALGGHSVALDSGTLAVLRLLELITPEEQHSGVVAGLERAIAKNKGIEFGSLLHQLGADYVGNPYSSALHKILLQIDPEVAPRLPKRRKGEPPLAPLAVPVAVPAVGEDGKRHARPAAAGETAKPESKGAAAKPDEGNPPEAAADHPAKALRPPAAAVASEEAKARKKKKAVEPPRPAPPAAKGKPAAAAADQSKPLAKKKPSAKKESEEDSGGGRAKKSPALGLTKRKPR